MIEAKINLANALGPGFFRRLAAQIDRKISERMDYWGNRKLDQYLTPGKGQPYTITIDGIAANSRADFKHARKRIQILFIQELISLAIGEIKAAMIAAISERAPKQGSPGEWTNVPALQAGVDVFYGGKGKPITKVNVREITSFQPGDVVLVVPNYATQVYANATKFRGAGPGILAAAVRKIRSVVIQRGKSSALKVSTQRSRAAFYKMMERGKPRRPDGSPIDMTVPWPGADSMWVVSIRYRENYKGTVR